MLEVYNHVLDQMTPEEFEVSRSRSKHQNTYKKVWVQCCFIRKSKEHHHSKKERDWHFGNHRLKFYELLFKQMSPVWGIKGHAIFLAKSDMKLVNCHGETILISHFTVLFVLYIVLFSPIPRAQVWSYCTHWCPKSLRRIYSARLILLSPSWCQLQHLILNLLRCEPLCATIRPCSRTSSCEMFVLLNKLFCNFPRPEQLL